MAESPATGKSVAGILNPFADDLFGTGGNEMEQHVLTRLGKIKLVQRIGTSIALLQCIQCTEAFWERGKLATE